VQVAVIVRLRAEALIEGRVEGHVEVVDTGQRMPIHDAPELIEVLCALAPAFGAPQRPTQEAGT
jgi:hypothetical protein